MGTATVLNGNLKGSNRDYAQAEIEAKKCHFNPDWINSATDAIDDGIELVVLAHQSVGVVKLLHEYIHLLTPEIMRLAHTLAGTPLEELQKPEAFDTPTKIGSKMVRVFDSLGNKLRDQQCGDMGLQGEEELFGFRVQFEPRSGKDEDTFIPIGVFFTDQSRTGRVFESLDLFKEWATAVTTGPVDPDRLRVRTSNTIHLAKRKKEHETLQGTFKSFGASLITDLDDSVGHNTEADAQNTVDGDAQEEHQHCADSSDVSECVEHVDSLLPRGWKN